MRRFALLMISLSPIAIGTVGLALVAVAQQPEAPIAKGVIYGTAFDQKGQPAKDIGLTASPLDGAP